MALGVRRDVWFPVVAPAISDEDRDRESQGSGDCFARKCDRNDDHDRHKRTQHNEKPPRPHTRDGHARIGVKALAESHTTGTRAAALFSKVEGPSKITTQPNGGKFRREGGGTGGGVIAAK